MTQRFVLDENIVILAQKGENDQGEADSTCLELLTQIITICHTIVLDPNLRERYLHQLNLPPHYDPRSGFRLLPILRRAEFREGKVDIRPSNAVPFPEEGNIPQGSQDDLPVVRLAVETGATLVTTDRPLRNGLNSSGVQQQYSLQVLSPEDALHRL